MEEWRKLYTPNERDRAYYEILAGGAKARLLESVIDFELPALLASQGPLEVKEIAQKLAMHPHRARKWLHLLSLLKLVKKVPAAKKTDYGDELYALGPLGQGIFGEDGKGGPSFRTMVQYWRWVAALDFKAVLQGLPLTNVVRWPPKDLAAAAELHQEWMGLTASGPIHAVERAIDLDGVKRMLDMGGGDATMACAFVRDHPNLEITVFDMPESAYLARVKISQARLTGRVSVVEGNFLTDELPQGFDLVLWSRCLIDWSAKTVTGLLKKTRKALIPGGRVAICESLLDGNEDVALAWEFRYLFYDDLEAAVVKPWAVHEQLLQEAGFEIEAVRGPDEETCYTVIIAKSSSQG